MNDEAKLPNAPDIGDYLKVFACTAVMLQTILGLALQTHPSLAVQAGIGITYNLIKFTAPAFIVGILYTTIRVTGGTNLTYHGYLGQMWHSLFVPTILWTAIYLLAMPWVQQVSHDHTPVQFAWQFVNGNAAPHLWYNSMMLQFIILMPVFWGLAKWCGKRSKHGIVTLVATVIIYFSWIIFYDLQVFHGPHMRDWYLLDRLFISFLLYGVLGVLAWQYRDFTAHFLRKWWLTITLVAIAAFIWINVELFSFKFPILLTNAPYYKPSMAIYDLAVIGLISTLAVVQIKRRLPITQTIHIMANYAYPAFLSNVFWDQLLWLAFGRKLTIAQPVAGIVMTYVGTWVLSFASAVIIHWVWTRIREWSSK
ncbi:acyltransferase [Lentilactobacillus otakiensis]|uniref:acyltransferase n=1 Tax=Lentilactobacillus otakiensis TaxID=481720 RepID=UPI001CBE8239|nr:acyltransferase [Lentilactobacillus otakiensis]MBZ3777343.1 acyltransferase [Lentilactobacillus otakiensis]MDV3518601.1 acyltransferase [Lentilactobacillus otakiensis]